MQLINPQSTSVEYPGHRMATRKQQTFKEKGLTRLGGDYVSRLFFLICICCEHPFGSDLFNSCVNHPMDLVMLVCKVD